MAVMSPFRWPKFADMLRSELRPPTVVSTG
jgi:hypothetical protein